MRRVIKFGVYVLKSNASDMVTVKQRNIWCMSAPGSCWTKAVLFKAFNKPDNVTLMMAESVFSSHYKYVGRYFTRTVTVETLIP